MTSSTDTQTLRGWLAQGPFALAMSSGFFGFYAHAGVLAALQAAGFRPNRVTGSSAGALVGGLCAGGMDALEIVGELERVRRVDFWDPALGPGLLRGHRFRRLLERLLPRRSFADCHIPATLSIYDVFARTTRVADRGDLAAAIHASCALPLLFHPVRIEGRLYSDGGIADRPGIAGLPSGERTLYHHLASRSPWRRRHAASMRLPTRAQLVTLQLDELPRANPFRLERGREAMALARVTAERALDEPFANGVLRLSTAA